jgi:hypothetical protein
MNNEYEDYVFDMECQYEDPAWKLNQINGELAVTAMQSAREHVDLLYDELMQQREYHEHMMFYLHAQR